ncbi:RNA-directed DNA polymerase, eukaryota, reverse transcriptase zinc-binding domain protein, partial [Tanacetum coccineum]
FILPITISNEVERIMRDFLWNFGVFKKGKARIRWSDVCKLKIEGGLDCKVAYVIEDGMWKWPDVLSVEFDGLKVIDPPCLIEDKLDKVFWRSKTGRILDFSVGVVWNDLRDCSDVVPWAKLVWFSQNIPRHAFLMWLAVHGRLRTQGCLNPKP